MPVTGYHIPCHALELRGSAGRESYCVPVNGISVSHDIIHSNPAMFADLAMRDGLLVEKLDQAVTDNGMFVVTRASASKGAAGRGITIRGDMVVGVYRNDFAVRMLEASVPAGIEAPIRFHIYETADGKANLAYWTPSTVFKPYDGGETLRLMAEELDSIFALIAQQAIAP